MPLNELIDSCAEYTEYPNNLKHNESIRPYMLRSLHNKLIEESPRLFCSDNEAIFRLTQVDQRQRKFLDSQFANLQSLRQAMPCDGSYGQDRLTCQFAFIEAFSSRDVLDISKDMMLWILSVFQVMPNFLEFVFPFGEQLYDYDFQFSAFRQDIRLSSGTTRGKYTEVLRSGQDFQMCYNLKSIEQKPKDVWGWSARQAAIFHSFDVGTGQANWIIIKANANLRERVGEALRKALYDNPSMYEDLSSKFANTLMYQLVVVDWCAENWRWYIKYFEEQLESSTSRALLYKPAGQPTKADLAHVRVSSAPQPLFPSARTWTDRILRANTSRPTREPQIPLRPVTLPGAATIAYEEPDQLPPEFSALDQVAPGVGATSGIQIDELQNAQYLETKADEAALVLRSNISVLSAMGLHYEEVALEIAKLPGLDQTFKTAAQLATSNFERHLRQVRADLESHLARMERISKLATDRKTLLYELVDYQNMRANEAFARKSQASAVRMEDMTQEMQSLTRKTAVETVLMRIITVVTVLFLPGTFVSTMMSAGIIDFPPKDSSIKAGTTSLGALKFFLCLTLTLMVATFGTGFGFVALEARHAN